MKVTPVSYKSNPIRTAEVEKYPGLGINEQVGTLGLRSTGAKPGNQGKKSEKTDLGSWVEASRHSHMSLESQGPR